MKKISTISIVIISIFILTGCGSSSSENKSNYNKQNMINRSEFEETASDCLDRCDRYDHQKCLGPDGEIDPASDCDLNKCMNNCLEE